MNVNLFVKDLFHVGGCSSWMFTGLWCGPNTKHSDIIGKDVDIEGVIYGVTAVEAFKDPIKMGDNIGFLVQRNGKNISSRDAYHVTLQKELREIAYPRPD